MDNNILVFDTQEQADQALAVINQIAENYWTARGYTVIDHQLIGKKNGIDNPDACRTIAWDIVQESPEGTYYFSDPANDIKFIDWREHLPEGVTVHDATVFPQEWIAIEEDRT